MSTVHILPQGRIVGNALYCHSFRDYWIYTTESHFPQATPFLGKSIMVQWRTIVTGHFSSGLPMWGQWGCCLACLAARLLLSPAPWLSVPQVWIPKALTNKHSAHSPSLWGPLPREPSLQQTLLSTSPVSVNISMLLLSPLPFSLTSPVSLVYYHFIEF